MEFDFFNNLDLSLFTLEEIDQLKKRIFLKERRGKEVPFVNCIIREKPIQIKQEEYLRLLKKNATKNLAFPEKLSMNVLDYFI